MDEVRNQMEEKQEFEGWAILELMGHRKLAGYCRWTQGPLLRIDVPGDNPGDPNVATQFYSPAALYCLTPTTEDLARKVAKGCRPEPVARWELPALPEPAPRTTGASHLDADLECGNCQHPKSSHVNVKGLLECQEDDGSEPDGCSCAQFDPTF